MNLQEFLEYRKFCPVCQSQLVTSFHSHRKQVVKIQENRLVAIFKVEPLHKSGTGSSFKAGYAFDYDTLTFGVEFWDKSDVQSYDLVSKFWIDKFLALHQNLGKFKFYRDCTYCHQYQYVSSPISMDFKTSTVSEFQIGHEEICFSQSIEKWFRIYRMVNSHVANTTHLWICKSSFNRKSIHLDMPAESMKLEFPLIFITDPETMAVRFSNLLVFA